MSSQDQAAEFLASIATVICPQLMCATMWENLGNLWWREVKERPAEHSEVVGGRHRGLRLPGLQDPPWEEGAQGGQVVCARLTV